MRTAVIDIGTNTLLLLVVERHPNTGALIPLVDWCRFGKLGRGLDATGKLHPESIATSLDICREYRAAMDEYGVGRVLPIATQAAREATNAADFIAPAEQILGAKIDIIAGAREAELAFAAVTHTFADLRGTPFVVVDVGGGSTEFIATHNGESIDFARSIPIGARRMTERHGADLVAMRADIATQITALAPHLPTGVPVIGTAGTATTIAAIELALATYDPIAVTGLRIAPAAIDAQLARLVASPDRRTIVGLPPERADVIAGGVAIYAEALRILAAPTMIACDRGIRWGVAYTSIT